MGKTTVVGVPVLLYIIVIVPQMFHEIKQHGKGMLCHGMSRVIRHIPPGNPSLLQICLVQIVGTGSRHADQLQLFCLSQRLFIHRCFVNNQHLGIFYPLRYFIRRREIVLNHLTQFVVIRQINVLTNGFRI